MKCNIDGAARGVPGLTACGSLFQDRDTAFVGGFTHYHLSRTSWCYLSC